MPSVNESKRLRALRRRKDRRARGEFLVEGPRVLSDLVETGRSVTFVLYTEEAADEPEGRALLERLVARDVASERVSEAEIKRHADTVTPQGWLAAAPIPRWGWPDIVAPGILLLDGLQDPGNVGTLIRAAEALGSGGVVLLPGTADPWGPKAVRAAAGSSLRLPVIEAGWGEVLTHLRAEGIPIWVAASDGEPAGRIEGDDERPALVLGNEGAGVSEPIRRDADRAVAIPMRGGVESLNVALAGAILMDRFFGG
jgi:TrmH family RNA methyltransferase